MAVKPKPRRQTTVNKCVLVPTFEKIREQPQQIKLIQKFERARRTRNPVAFMQQQTGTNLYKHALKASCTNLSVSNQNLC